MRTKNTNLIDAAVKIINESARLMVERKSSGDVVYTGYVIANGDEFIKFGPQPAGPKQMYTFSRDYSLATKFRDFAGAKAAKDAFTERLGLDVEKNTKSIQTYQKRIAANLQQIHFPVGSDDEIPLKSFMPMYNTNILKKEIDSKRSLNNLKVLKVTIEEAE